MGVEAQGTAIDDLEVVNINSSVCIIPEMESTTSNNATVAELESRLRIRMREVRVIQDHLKKYGIDEEELLRQQNTQLTAMSAKDSKITLLERRVNRLEEIITQKERQIDQLSSELKDYQERNSSANLLRTHLAETVEKEEHLRRLVSVEAATKNKVQSTENDILLQRIVKLKNLCKNTRRRHETFAQITENQLMFEQDRQVYAELYAMRITGELFDIKKRNSVEQKHHNNASMAAIEVVFQEPVRMTSVDDEYIESITNRSLHNVALSSFKKDLSDWVHEASSRLGSVMKFLFKQLDVPKSRNPRPNAAKMITETQRKAKISVRELSRCVNKLILSVLEVERSTAKKFAAVYETDKFANRVSESSQCDIPGPPDPIIERQKNLLLKATQTQETLRSRLKATKKERDSFTEKYNTASENFYNLHNTMHQTFKAVWTHRYRFKESLEDPIRLISKRLSENDSKRRSASGPDPAQAQDHLKKVFANNLPEVAQRDTEVLEHFSRYVTSDSLYKMDMVTHGRQKREEEARKKNAAASIAIHTSPKRNNKSDAGSVASPNAGRSEASSPGRARNSSNSPERKKKIKIIKKDESPQPVQPVHPLVVSEPVIDIGCRVRAVNLQEDNWRWLNGSMGTVLHMDEETKRFNVCFSSGTLPMSVANLKLLGPARPSLIIPTSKLSLGGGSDASDDNGPDSARTQPTPRSSIVPKAPDVSFARLSPRVVESHSRFSPSAGVLTSSAAIIESTVKSITPNNKTTGIKKRTYPPLQASNAFVRFATDGYDKKGAQLRSSGLVQIRGMRVNSAF